MRDPQRIPRVLNLLGRVWAEVPDWRLGQLIENIARDTGWNDAFYMSDDDLEKGVKELLDRWKEQENTTH